MSDQNLKTSFGGADQYLAGHGDKDPITGLFVSDPLLEQIHDYCKTSPATTYLIAADFVNLSQINDVLGREVANEVIETVVNIYQKELYGLNPDTLTGFRAHGDDMEFVLEGDVDQKQLLEALTRAEEATRFFVQETGLDLLQHPRHKNVVGTGLTTTFTKIDKFSGTMFDTKNDLAFQLSTTRDMVPRLSHHTVQSKDLLNETDLNKVKAVFGEYAHYKKYKKESQLPVGFKPERSPDGVVQQRRDEIEAIKDALEHGHSSLIRLNLYNLGGLNSLLGNDAVNGHVLQPVKDMIVSCAKSHFDGTFVEVFERGGAEYDLLVVDQDPDRLLAFKRDLQDTANKAIFGKSVGEFMDDIGVPVDETKYNINARMYDLDHKRGQKAGAGLTMVDVQVDAGDSFIDVFQHLESSRRIHEYHGAAFIEAGNDEGGMAIHQIGHKTMHASIAPQRSLDTVRSHEPYAWSLSNLLNIGQVSEVFNKPVGLIYEALSGVSLQPVLNRQQAIFKLMDHGVDPQDIKAHMGSEEEFDQFVKDTVLDEDITTLDMAGRASTRPHGHPEFLTFNLAEQWGYVPENIKGIAEACLKVQAATRAAKEITDYKTNFRATNSIEILPELYKRAEPILEDAGNKESALQNAQYVDQITRILKHEMSAADKAPNAPVVIAASSLVQKTLLEASDDFHQMGLDQLGDTIAKYARTYHLGPRAMDAEMAFTILKTELQNFADQSPAVASVNAASVQSVAARRYSPA